MSDGEWTDGDEPDIGARCLKLCREVIWNTNDPEAPYTLRGVIQRLRPRSEYPALIRRMFSLYVEYYGDPGEYDVWFELVRLVPDDVGDVVDEVEETSFGPFVLTLDVGGVIYGRMYVLRSLPLSEPGVYELRLRIGGVETPLISERLFVED